MNTCLSIAGSDPSGGAGIQADLKTMTVNGVYAMCAITALTVQNTLGVTNILEVEPDFLGQQIDAVFQDIRPDAVKVGMVSSAGLIRVIAQKLRQHGAQNVGGGPGDGGHQRLPPAGKRRRTALREELFPLAAVVTPQHPRGPGAVWVGDFHPRGHGACRPAHRGCLRLRRAVQGRPQPQRRQRLPVPPGAGPVVPGRRIQNPNTHGTGCTLSSAIAANLAKGQDLETAVATAKEYLSGAPGYHAGPGPRQAAPWTTPMH